MIVCGTAGIFTIGENPKQICQVQVLLEESFAPGFFVQGQVLSNNELTCVMKIMIALVEAIRKIGKEIVF
jgi:hypothetical protein